MFVASIFKAPYDDRLGKLNRRFSPINADFSLAILARNQYSSSVSICVHLRLTALSTMLLTLCAMRLAFCCSPSLRESAVNNSLRAWLSQRLIRLSPRLIRPLADSGGVFGAKIFVEFATPIMKSSDQSAPACSSVAGSFFGGTARSRSTNMAIKTPARILKAKL